MIEQIWLAVSVCDLPPLYEILVATQDRPTALQVATDAYGYQENEAAYSFERDPQPIRWVDTERVLSSSEHCVGFDDLFVACGGAEDPAYYAVFLLPVCGRESDSSVLAPDLGYLLAWCKQHDAAFRVQQKAMT